MEFSMQYDDIRYKYYMSKIENGRYFVTDIELREVTNVVSMQTIRQTANIDTTGLYPTETYISHEMIVSLADSMEQMRETSIMIIFNAGYNLEKIIMPVYEKLLQKRKRK